MEIEFDDGSSLDPEQVREMGRWTQLRTNESLHSPAENDAARQRCRQLIDGGVAAVDWVGLYGQK